MHSQEEGRNEVALQTFPPPGNLLSLYFFKICRSFTVSKFINNYFCSFTQGNRLPAEKKYLSVAMIKEWRVSGRTGANRVVWKSVSVLFAFIS